MIEAITRLVLGNLTPLLFILAFVIASSVKAPPSYCARLLNWLLLLPIGFGSLWSGAFHVFFPEIASRSIGWQPSPFEYEVGVADMAMGITAMVSFWRPLAFKAAVILCLVLFYFGVAVNHVHDAFAGGNLAPNNFGALLAVTIAEIILLPLLYLQAKRETGSA
ncbi:hypothetical protein DK26_18405 [Bosea sp. WAO]|uniref:DUF6790 family protein n=1 Tax=Bosea sp. WAO TaxID=406341 RepID=UPI00074956C9|nr:DUF6790 family protein [Bosea sp. WAO]KUL94828.1 hypothetical protein DK26_18405 [Bosea sp. WAO]